MVRPLTAGAIAALKTSLQTRLEMPEEEKRMANRPPEKFDPDYVATLRKILDIAVEQIAQENRTPATKAKMAQTIVRRAADGVTDASDLVSSAVRVGETRAA
jgi:hypothetical protein